MFDHVGWGEMSVILLLALFVFGPDRLPGIARDAGRAIHKLRTQLRGMTEDIKTELGPELGNLDLQSLHPKTFMATLLADDAPIAEEVAATPLGQAGRPRGSLPLGPGEHPPWDPDTT